MTSSVIYQRNDNHLEFLTETKSDPGLVRDENCVPGNDPDRGREQRV